MQKPVIDIGPRLLELAGRDRYDARFLRSSQIRLLDAVMA